AMLIAITSAPYETNAPTLAPHTADDVVNSRAPVSNHTPATVALARVNHRGRSLRAATTATATSAATTGNNEIAPTICDITNNAAVSSGPIASPLSPIVARSVAR